MVGKGNLAIFESSSISKTGEATPTKIGVHAYYIKAYLHEFLSQFQLINFFDDHGLLSHYPYYMYIRKDRSLPCAS